MRVNGPASILPLALGLVLVCVACAAGASVSADPEYVGLVFKSAQTSLQKSRSTRASALTTRTALSLSDCTSLALQRSLVLEEEALEALSKHSLVASYRVQQYPHLVGSGELSERDNLPFAFSEILGHEGQGPSLGSGTGVNQFSRGHDAGTWRYSMEAHWSPTDAALAHYLMKSAHNDERKERLMRTRVAQKLVGVVEAGYYRLLSLDRSGQLIRDLLTKRESLKTMAAQLYKEDLTGVEELARVDQKAIQARGLASSLAAETDLQREYLGSAMRVSPDSFGDKGFGLEGVLDAPRAIDPIETLERTAVEHRPEAFQAGLDYLSSKNDLKRTNIKFYPKVTGFGRYTRDIDKHQLYNDWREYGAYIYFDVLDLAANHQENRAARRRTSKARSEIESVALGIASQVREAALKCRQALADVDTAAQVLSSARQLLDTQRARASAGAATDLVVLESEGDVLQEEISHLRALGEARARVAELSAAMGTNYTAPLPR